MDEKTAYEQKMQAQLDIWAAEIDKLQAKARKAEAEQKIKYHEQVDKLKQLQAKAESKLDELRRNSTEAWESLQKGVNSAWDSLGAALKDAYSKFK